MLSPLWKLKKGLSQQPLRRACASVLTGDAPAGFPSALAAAPAEQLGPVAAQLALVDGLGPPVRGPGPPVVDHGRLVAERSVQPVVRLVQPHLPHQAVAVLRETAPIRNLHFLSLFHQPFPYCRPLDP